MTVKTFIFRATKRQKLNTECFKVFLKNQRLLEKDGNRNKKQNFIFERESDTLSNSNPKK